MDEGGEVVWAAAIERDTPALAILRVERALGPKSAPPSEIARLTLSTLPALSVAALAQTGAFMAFSEWVAWRSDPHAGILRMGGGEVGPPVRPSRERMRRGELGSGHGGVEDLVAQ